MTKELRWLLNFSVALAYDCVDYSRLKVSLDECYETYSSDKYRADLYNRNMFDKAVEKIEQKYTFGSNVPFIHKWHVVVSHNCMFFTTLQVAYFFQKIDGKEDKDECYIYFRYDTPFRTVEKYVKYFKDEPNITSVHDNLDDMFYHGC